MIFLPLAFSLLADSEKFQYGRGISKRMMVEFNAESVRRAADGVIAARPTYRRLITLYGSIFAAQENARLRVRMDPIHLPPELVRIKHREEMPLVMRSEMVFDPANSGELLAELCRIAFDCGSELADSARVLSAQFEKVKGLFEAFLKEDESTVVAAADTIGVDAKALVFFLYHSMRPSLCCCEQQLTGFLDRGKIWDRGYCPVCGSPPGLGWLEGDGSRSLFCSFCWHQWPLQRVLCPFCGNREQGRLAYIYSEDEREYRLDVCDSCRKYIKTVDTRNLARASYPPLEQIASLHMDLKAVEAGYESGLSNSISP